MRVRIGVSDSAREIELDIEDVEAFVEAVETAIKGESVVWVDDTEGHRVGIPGKSISFIDISPESKRSAGF